MNWTHPEVGFLFIIWILIGAYLFWKRVKKTPWKSIPSSNHFFRDLFFWLAFGAIIFAAMGPKGNPHYSEAEIALDKKRALREDKSLDLVIVLDVSSSMEVTDTPTREARLKTALNTLDDLIRDLDGGYFTLYLFTSTSEKSIPRTLDQIFFRLMLREVTFNQTGIEGTDLKVALDRLREDQIGPEKTVLLVTDGDDTEFYSLTGIDRANRLEEIKKAYPHPMIVLGIGSKEGGEIPKITYKGRPVVSHLRENLLKELGNYLQQSNLSSRELYDVVSKAAAFNVKRESQGDKTILYDEYYQWPLGIALLLIVLALFMPQTLLRISTLIFIFTLNAEEPETLYDAGLYEDAYKAYQQMEPKNEWEKGVIPLNEALSLIEAGKLDEAALQLASFEPTNKSSPYFLTEWYLAKARVYEAWANQGIYPPFFYAMSLKFLKEANIQSCLQSRLEGATSCPPSFQINQARLRVKEGLTKYVDNNDEPAFSVPLWIERVKEGRYQAYLNDEAIENWHLNSLEEAYRNLKQNDPKEGLAFLEEAMKQLPELSPLINPYLNVEDAINAYRKYEGPKKSKDLTDWLKIALQQEYAVFAVSQLGQKIEDLQKRALDWLDQFYSVIYQDELDKFMKAGCDRTNGVKIYQLFNQAYQLASVKNINTAEIMQVIILLKQIEETLKTDRSPQQEQNSETLQSLQDMMLQDETTKVTPAGSGVERPW